MEKFKLLITSHSFGSCGEDVFTKLESAGIEYKTIHSKQILKEEDFLDIIDDYDGVIVGADIISKKVIDKAEKLKIISKHGIGLDNIDLQAAKEKGITVSFARGSNSVAVAELAIAMMMNLARLVDISSKEIKNGEWIRRKGKELSGSVVGVVGTGNIGKELIKRIAAFGSEILMYDQFQDHALEEKYNARYVNLNELLRRSDFVSLHLPYMPETKDLLDKETLSLMKKDSYLINCARGGIVNEDDLYEALKDKKIAGAAIDTFVDEPPFGSKLLELDNLICTPHLGAYTNQAINNMSQMSAQAIIDFVEGRVAIDQV